MEKEVSEVERARQILEEDQRQRLENCRAAIGQALEQYGCELVALLHTNLGTLTVPVELRVK